MPKPAITPSMGRIVLYTTLGPGRVLRAYPAIVTNVYPENELFVSEGIINVQVFVDHKTIDATFREEVAYSESGEIGTWQWPPRV